MYSGKNEKWEEESAKLRPIYTLQKGPPILICDSSMTRSFENIPYSIITSFPGVHGVESASLPLGARVEDKVE